MNPDQDTVDDIEEIFKNRRLDQNAQIDQTPLHIAIAKSQYNTAVHLLSFLAPVWPGFELGC